MNTSLQNTYKKIKNTIATKKFSGIFVSIVLLAMTLNLVSLGKIQVDKLQVASATDQNLSQGQTQDLPRDYIFQSDVGILATSVLGKNVNLIDAQGKVLNTWKTDFSGIAAYIDEQGSLWRAEKIEDGNFKYGGKGGQISQYSKTGQLLWRFVYNDENKTLHHDFKILPNGNVLAIVWNKIPKAQMTGLGRVPERTSDDGLWVDSIIEVKPTGADSGQIVWEWKIIDHVVQDLDPQKPNYGILSENKDKFDVNAKTGETDLRNWNHINSIDYNPKTNEILLSVRAVNELWIIAHNTTSENKNESGIVRRYGNDANFGGISDEENQLYKQHNAHWIEPGLVGAGSIMVFDNGNERVRPYSRVLELTPNGEDFIQKTVYGGRETGLFAPFLSGAQRLSDGSTLITDGPSGRCFVIDKSSEIIWEQQFSKEDGGPDQIFRCTAYQVTK